MTLESTLRASATLPRHRLWGIARDHQAGAPVDFEVTWTDFERDIAWAVTVLCRLGVQRGAAVLVVGHIAEAPWFDPIEHAVLRLGAHYSLTENMGFEAFRAVMYGRRLGPDLVIGLNRAIAEAMGDELPDAFAGVRSIWARPDTVALVQSAGLSAAVISRIGPALALECAVGSGAHVNPAEWAVEEQDGELLLTTVGPRAYRLDRASVAVAGSVRTEPCGCGLPGLRVDIDPTRAV